MTYNRDVGQISNELEFSLYNTDVDKVIADQIARPERLFIVPEINSRDIIELNVSLAQNIQELNSRVDKDVSTLIQRVETLGGMIYGGSSVLSDVSSVNPKRYRTTSLSETAAQGFLDITSQQIVLGVTEEKLGFDLYNFFRKINPVFLALTASSSYKYKNGNLEDTGCVSRRIGQYEQFCKYFPESMWKMMPELHSLKEYLAYLQRISDAVNYRLYNGLLDANWEELNKVRVDHNNKTFSYVPFTLLEPHQIYWFIRVRPDHRTIEKGGNSLFSLELRVPDMPTTVSKIQMMNSFVVGLSYYIADHDSGELPTPFNGEFDDLRTTAKYGLNNRINYIDMRKLADDLRRYAVRGLEDRGYSAECSRFNTLEKILIRGNDADLIRRVAPQNVGVLRTYLVSKFKEGLV